LDVEGINRVLQTSKEREFNMGQFVKGQKSVGRVFVKAVRPSEVDLSVHQPGQWVAGPNGTLVRLAHNGYVVPRTGGRKTKKNPGTVSNAAFRQACGKPVRKVLTPVATRSTEEVINNLLAAIMP
jgi:hypothetical protein